MSPVLSWIFACSKQQHRLPKAKISQGLARALPVVMMVVALAVVVVVVAVAMTVVFCKVMRPHRWHPRSEVLVRNLQILTTTLIWESQRVYECPFLVFVRSSCLLFLLFVRLVGDRLCVGHLCFVFLLQQQKRKEGRPSVEWSQHTIIIPRKNCNDFEVLGD